MLRIREIDITGKTEGEIKQLLRLEGLGESEIDTVLGTKGITQKSEVQFRYKKVAIRWDDMA